MNIKLIVTDLDRTLLNTDKTISDYTSRILARCREQGIKVAFATARSEAQSKKFVDSIKPDAVISNGGAIVRVGDTAIYRAVIDAKTADKLIHACARQPSVTYITADTDKGYFVDRPIDDSDPNWADYLPVRHIDFSQGLGCDAYKITIECLDSAVVGEIAAALPAISVTAFFGENWYGFADKAAGKWRGVASLLEHFGFSKADVAAFGDDFSDVEMIRECGIGVAVANAIDDVKAAADYICGANGENGVARWLEEHVL